MITALLGLLLMGLDGGEGGRSAVNRVPLRLERFAFDRMAMGTRFRLVLYAPSDAVATRAASAAFDRIRALDALLSDYDPKSELSRLSARSGGGAVFVSAPLKTVLERAQDIAHRSGGAFDVTVGPFVQLWRAAHRSGRLPDPDALALARTRVGYRLLRIDRSEDGARVTLAVPNMALDLGAIAKGYAADEALRALREHECSRALVDAGGDLALGDPPPKKAGWRIDVAGKGADAPPVRRLILSNVGVATSGDLHRHLTVGGVRYSHIVDPRTGLGVTGGPQVTVIAQDAITADALASAVGVLGVGGLPMVEAIEGAAALLLRDEADSGSPTCVASSRFPVE
jgi:thiamine biosynthesis lipoprotein